jgi:formyltetrahydrofolate deformylase
MRAAGGAEPTGVLLLSCPDRPGVVHGVAEFLLAARANILHAEQHIDVESGVFFQRVEFSAPRLDAQQLSRDFAPVADRFAMTARLRMTSDRTRVAILASKQAHCLTDLLARWRSGELHAEIAVIVSNHPDHAALAEFHGVPYRHLPVTPQTKPDQERRLLATLAEHEVELVVLARYMQILGPSVLAMYPARIINIHHSFLPAFAGARPYHQAQHRGVKLIGATAHYATADLDEGPIIEQDVTPVSHRDSVVDMIRKGRDLETVVLARAVRAHVEHRTLVYGNKTIVFG